MTIIYFFSLIVLIFTISSTLIYFLLFSLSLRSLRKGYQLGEVEPYEDYLNDATITPISIILPAFNEEPVIADSIRSLLSIEYPNYEVIVVNDGSTDKTLDLLIKKYKLVKSNDVYCKKIATEKVNAIYHSKVFPKLTVVDKENGGKSDALNAGINISANPIFCSIDADSYLERKAFAKVIKPLIDSDDVIASSGTVRIANGCKIENGEITKINLAKKPTVVMQVIEYLRTFLVGRFGLSQMNMLLIISGTFGVFSKKWVIEAGGYSTKTVGEDMELVVRLHRINRERKMNKKIVYIPDPVCWTEAPDKFSSIRKQRNRWHLGLCQSIWMHKRLFLNPKYGRIGLISVPYFTFIELLGPLIELLGYILIIISLLYYNVLLKLAIILITLAIINGSLLSMSAVLLEEWGLKKYPKMRDITKLFLYSLTETFWYRPLLTLWKCEGYLLFLFRKKHWHKTKRKGLSESTTENYSNGI
jgi:cellulose synthase/poly-beta-1,6-N-acetylglucosamine synthase-like glycosyltransferase